MLALLLGPGVAHADAKPQLTAARVIAIAASDPAVGPLLAAHKGTHWEVVFDAPSGTWTAVLEPRGKHTVLASFKIDDWWRWPGTLALIVNEYNKYLVALARYTLRG